MLQDSEPDLPGENAHDQQVINSFLNLVTKRTSSWVGKAFSSQAIGYPAPIEYNSPQKELALAGCPTLPNPLPRTKTGGSNEQSLISRFRCILT